MAHSSRDFGIPIQPPPRLLVLDSHIAELPHVGGVRVGRSIPIEDEPHPQRVAGPAVQSNLQTGPGIGRRDGVQRLPGPAIQADLHHRG